MSIPENYTYLIQSIEAIEQKLGYTFHERALLVKAFTHRSFANEHRDIAPEHNERLEFFGDSVFNFIITEYLYLGHPHLPEGELSALRASLVNAASCERYVEELKIKQFLLLGKGEQYNPERARRSIYSDLFEAIIGAIYLDSDLDKTRHFFLTHFGKAIAKTVKNPPENWKIKLQEHIQKVMGVTPHYLTEEILGPEHDKTFVVSVYAGETKLGQGEGHSKKIAQSVAAENAFVQLSEDGSNGED